MSKSAKIVRNDFIAGCADCRRNQKRQKRNDQTRLLAIAEGLLTQPATVLTANHRQVPKRWADDIRDIATRITVTALIALVLPVLTLAQQSAQNDTPTLQLVAACNRGMYDACELVDGHWYYRKSDGTWTRDDGVVGKPPVVVTKTCEQGSTVFKRPDASPWYEAPPAKAGDSPWDLNAKLSVFAFAATASLDCWSTGKLRENNPLLRNSHGGINQAVCFGLNGGTLTLTMILQRKYPRGMTILRWFGAGAHAGAASWNWRQQ